MVRLTRAALPVLVLALLAAPALTAQQPPTAPQPLRLAFINSQAILAVTPGRAEAESTFNREMAGMRAEVERMQRQLDSNVAEYNRTQVVMTPQARQQREQQLRDQEQRTRQRAQELDQQAQQREAQLTAPIMQRVTAVIEGIRAEFNYAFVFDVAGQGTTIVTADRSLDITPLVIQRLQSAAPAPPPLGTAPDSTGARQVTPGQRPAGPTATPATPVRPRPRP